MICLREVRCTEEQVFNHLHQLNQYPYRYWSPSTDREGYAGVALFSKTKPLQVTFGCESKEFDGEGRVINAQYNGFYLICAYVPNSGRGLNRRVEQWDKEFLKFLKRLDARKAVILCGDLNVAHEEIDLAHPKRNQETPGFTKEERDNLTKLLFAGFIDSFRELYPNKRLLHILAIL